jgi:hypothetical protein
MAEAIEKNDMGEESVPNYDEVARVDNGYKE